MSSEPQGLVFDDEADAYERNRPAYPDAVFDRVLSPFGSDARPRVLEIGAGTGKATVPLAQRGCEIVALEPGDRMASVARTQLAGQPSVTIISSTFEDATIEPGAFDMVFAAQAFHWTDPDTRYERAQRALAPDGRLTILANGPVWPDDDPAKQAIRRIYDDLAPELMSAWPVGRKQGRDGRTWTEDIDVSGRFGQVETSGWAWSLRQDGPTYTDHLATQSDHQLFDPVRRAELFAELERWIGANGGSITVPYESRIWSAMRR